MKTFKNIFINFLYIFGLATAGCSEDPGIVPIYDEKGRLQVQMDSEKCKNYQLDELIKRFKKRGFVNFRISYLQDVYLGIFVKEDEIDSISINGETAFKNDSFVDEKSVVFISIHSKRGGYEYITNPVNGYLPIMYQPHELDGKDKIEAGNCLKQIGFGNISYYPIQDCWNDGSSNFNKADSFQVNYTPDFREYSFFQIDSVIRINYHTVKGDYCTNGLNHEYIKNEVDNSFTCSICGKTLYT